MKSWIHGAAALVIGLGFGSAADAALITFQVDPTQSVLTLGHLINIGNTLQEPLNQGVPQTGGESASFSGTFEAEIVGNTINFLGGGDVVASNSAGPLEPGGAPANWAFRTGLGEEAAIRDFRFAFQKNDPTQPFQVDAEGHLIDTVLGGEWAPDLAASWTLSRFGNTAGFNLLYNPDFPAILTKVGDEYRLQIPVDVQITWAEAGANDSQFHLVGEIIATSQVPEPGVVSLLAGGAVMLLSRRRLA